MKKIISIIALVLTSISAGYAGDITGITKATATLAATCGFNISDIEYGQVNPGDNNVLSNTTLYTLCTKGTVYKIEIQYSAQDYAEQAANLRGRTYGDKIRLAISLPDSTSVFYDTRADYYQATGTGLPINYTITSKLFSIPYVTPDVYTDQLTVFMIY